MHTKMKPQLVIEAEIIRKDGTKEKLGKISKSDDVNLIQKFIRSVKKNG